MVPAMKKALLLLLLATSSGCDEVTATPRRLRGQSMGDAKNDSNRVAEEVTETPQVHEAVSVFLARGDKVVCDEPLTAEGRKKWMQDMSASVARSYLARLQKLLPQAPALYKYLIGLNAFVNRTVQEMQNATGQCVTWGTHCGLEEIGDEAEDANANDNITTTTEEDLEADFTTTKMAGEWDPSALPPHATLVSNGEIYVNKEVQALWDLLTDIDRKRYGVLNAMGSRPYGPHGEHPELWEPQGYYPCANCSGAPTASEESANDDNETDMFGDAILLNLLEVTGEQDAGIFLSGKGGRSKVIRNYYHCRLAQDFNAIKRSFRELRRKISVLRENLIIVADAAKKFEASPSGVYNPCPPSICPSSKS